MKEAPIEIAKEFVGAINRQDVEAMMDMMSPDHRFTDSLGHVAVGRDGMGEGWKLYFQMVPDYRLEIQETFQEESAVVMLGMASGTYSHAFQDVEAMGIPNLMRDSGSRIPREWSTPAAVRAYIENGKVKEWRVYADNEPLRRLMKQLP